VTTARLCDNAPEMTTSRHDTDQPGHEGAVAHHDADDHGDDHGHDDHAHDDTEPLGPIDIYAWGAGALGVMLGLGVAWAFASSTGMF
jgi:ABC-type Zn2+ transport system substrate-binding protein/surface adhesin